MRATEGSENVFEDLGFRREEAANLKVRADLMLNLRRFIERQGWSQKRAARFFGETQPRISNLMRGEIDRFSVDKLINMHMMAGMDITAELAQLAARCLASLGGTEEGLTTDPRRPRQRSQ